MVAGALLFAVGAVLQGVTYRLAMFVVGRAVAGFAEGLCLSNINVYVTL